MDLDSILLTAPVIPVLTVGSVADAVPIAEALVAGGLPVIEVTLRTAAALDVIEAMRQVPGAIVGAGTVLTCRDLDAALAAGAAFIVSPGLSERLARTARDREIPFLPGVATAGEILAGLDLGLDRFKLFPAEAIGGLALLDALARPFRHVRFCPTGGIRPETAASWLAHPSVLCVGGSWLVPSGPVDPPAIRAAAAEAARLRPSGGGQA